MYGAVDVAALKRRLFDEKRTQLEYLLKEPLLLYWGKWEGPSVRTLTLADDFSRPAFFLLEPGGHTTAFVQQIETDQLSPLSDRVEVIPYKTVADLKEGMAPRLKRHPLWRGEISDEFFGFDRLPWAYVAFITQHARLESADAVLVPYRGVKSVTELSLMREAAQATINIFGAVAEMVKPGKAEEEIVRFLLHEAVDVAGKWAFTPIVASGPRSQNPHPERSSSRIIAKGDRVIVDFGVDVLGYKSDITRSYIAGGRPEDDPYYDISARLQRFVQSADLKKMTPAALGAACAQLVKDAGLSDRERHGYGHGLGVETHDPHPYIAAASTPWTERPFEDGMVFTFEPGFYDDAGGFRLEEDYVVWNGRVVLMQDWQP